MGKNGISHFIEHLLFKGTSRRSSLDIAREIDSVGGGLNAFTAREYMCCYSKVMEEDTHVALDILSDIYFNSTFPEKEFEKERGVIEQEIRMVEDTPDEYIHDLLHTASWGHTPFGMPVFGVWNTVKNITREMVFDFFNKVIRSSSVLLTVAGKTQADSFIPLAEKYFENDFSLPSQTDQGSPHYDHVFFNMKKREERDLEQMHLGLGFETFYQGDPRRYRLYVLNSILGGGMSSRLFQEIRENRGLAYNVYSFLCGYIKTGYLGIYAGIPAGSLNSVADIILKEIQKLKGEATLKEDTRRVKHQLRSQFLLSLESNYQMMNKMARDELYIGRHISPEEILELIEEVDQRHIRDIAGEIFDESRFSAVFLGPNTNEIDILRLDG